MATEKQILRQVAGAVPVAHQRFFEELPVTHETRDLFLVHAGVRPGLSLAEQEAGDLLWIRDQFLDDRRDHGKLVVHGHTPVDEPEHWGNRVNLDTGAGFYYALTVAVFEGREVSVLGPDGREALRPLV